jgi:hypothetical protein
LRTRGSFLVAAFALAATACSTHPLPEDFSRASTVDIVTSIRCEALAGLTSLTPEEQFRADTIIKTTMIGYDFVFHIDETNFAGGARKVTGAGLQDGFLTLQKGSAFSLDFFGSADLARQNERRFKILEPLTDLQTAENAQRCAGGTPRRNLAYPIAGSIGMDEVVRTYVKLELLSDLSEREIRARESKQKPSGQAKQDKGKDDKKEKQGGQDGAKPEQGGGKQGKKGAGGKPSGGKGGSGEGGGISKLGRGGNDDAPAPKAKENPPTRKMSVVYSDDISFITRLQVGQTTTLVLDAVVGRLKVTDASISASASRRDEHNVIVALAREEPEQRRRREEALKLNNEKVNRQYLLSLGSVRDPRTQADLIQMDEDAATRVAMELHRRRSLNDIDNEAVRALGQRFLDVLRGP